MFDAGEGWGLGRVVENDNEDGMGGCDLHSVWW